MDPHLNRAEALVRAQVKRPSSDPAFRYANFHALLMGYGIAGDTTQGKRRDCEPGSPQLCYSNVRRLVLSEPSLTYVEGLAINERGVPVLHAWAVDNQLTVAEPTWTGAAQYFGIAFATEWIASRAAGGRDSVFGDSDETVEYLKAGFLSVQLARITPEQTLQPAPQRFGIV